MDAADVKSKARELGFDLVGVCEAGPAPHWSEYRRWLDKGFHGAMDYLERHAAPKAHPENLLPGVKSIVAVGLNYNQPNPPEPGFPRIARYALGRDYHRVVRSKLNRLAAWMALSKHDADFRPCVDSAPILERDYAHLAGLGWFGKNTCLIDTRRGSWFVLGLLLTTVELEPDQPAVGACGECRRCVEACPTHAIVFEDGRWQVDSRRCVSYLTIEASGTAEAEGSDKPSTSGEAEGSVTPWVFGCDVCQEVCPFNQPRSEQPLRAQITCEPDFLAVRDWPPLRDLAGLDYDTWDRLTRGSPVRRAGYDGLRRAAAEQIL